MKKRLAFSARKGYYIVNFHSPAQGRGESKIFKRVENMKQSKLLKKSLAALLAILMVAAMIPMSAFAEDAPAPAEAPVAITIGGEEAVFDGTGYSVTLKYTEKSAPESIKKVPVSINQQGTTVQVWAGTAQLAIVSGITGTAGSKANMNLTKVADKPETPFGEYKLEARVIGKDNVSTAYPLTVTVEARDESSEKAVLDIKKDGIVSWSVEGKNITVVKALGVTAALTNASEISVSKGAEVSAITTASNVTTFKVTAEDGSSTNYTVKYELEKVFESFSIPNMVGEPEFEEDSNKLKVTVTMPFGTTVNSTKIVPTYTLADTVKSVTKGTDPNAVTVYDQKSGFASSGVAEFTTDASNGNVKFNVTTANNKDVSGATVSENVEIVLKTEEKNTAGELTGVAIGNQAVVPVKGSTTSVLYNTADRQSVSLFVSEGSKVTWQNPPSTVVEGANIKTDLDDDDDDDSSGTPDGKVTFTGVNFGTATGKVSSMKLFVEPQDGGAGKSYTLNFAKMTDTGVPSINSFTLTDEDGKTYTANEGNNWTITLPYGTPDPEAPTAAPAVDEDLPLAGLDMGEFTVSVDVSNGATVDTFARSIPAKYVSSALTTPSTRALADSPSAEVTPDPDAKTAPENGIGGDTKANALIFDTWYQYDNTTNPDAVWTATDENPSRPFLDEGNVYGAFVLDAYWTAPEDDRVASGETQNVTRKPVIIKREAPETESRLESIKLTTENDLSKVKPENTYTGTISSSADGSANYIRLDVPFTFSNSKPLYILEAKTSEGATLFNNAQSSAAQAKALDPKTLGVQSSIQPLVVASSNFVNTYEESQADDFDVATAKCKGVNVAVKAQDTTKSSTYKVYAIKAQAKTGNELTAITSTDRAITVEQTGKKFTIHVPTSYNGISDSTSKAFDLAFEVSEGAAINLGTAGENGIAYGETPADFKVVAKNLKYGGNKINGSKIYVTAESGDVATYDFAVVVDEVSTDATIASIKVGETEATAEEAAYTAVIADDTADLTKQILTIETTSPVAKVQIDGKDFDKTKTYDVSKEVKITVTAEDGTTKNEYTLIATIKPKSNDATLTGVSVDGVAATIAEEAITAEAEDPASVTLELTLPEGATAKVGETEYTAGMTVDATEAVTIVVTAEDGTEKTYTLTVSKKSSEPTPSPSPKPGLDDVNDVEANDWFAQYVANVLERGIMSADSKGNFRPGEKVTRSQFAVMMCNLNGVNPDEYANAENPYTDVKKDGWDFKWIMAAVANDWMSGTSSTTFEPGSYVTREQTALIIAKSQGLSKVTEPKELYSDDAQIASWAKGWVYACKEAGLMGYMSQSQKTFAPKGDLTRAQMATILSGIEAPSTPENPDDGNNPENPDEGNNPENPDEGNNPENPDEGNNPENPDEGSNPENPDEGNNPENPDEGNNPENPDEGNTPETPDEGSNPETPDEGSTGGDNTTGGETEAE